MTITPVERPAAKPFPIHAVTPEALAKPKTVALKPMAPKVPNNSVTPLDFGFKYAAPCGILTIYALDNGERQAISELQDWIILHIKKSKCAQCEEVYYGPGDGPELQEQLPL